MAGRAVEILGGFPWEHTGQRNMAIEAWGHFLVQRERRSSFGAGSSDPPVANTLEDLKGLWVKETVV